MEIKTMRSANISSLPIDTEKQKASSLWQDAVNYLLRDKLTIVALFILLLLTIIVVVGPWYITNIMELDPTDTSIPDRFMKPGSPDHWLGTDQLGRDQLLRLIFGGQVSIGIAYFASFMTVLIGITLGLIAGFYGGVADDLITWAVNTLSAVPPIFLLLIASALWEPTARLLIIILGLLGWIGTCRLVRGEVLSLKERDYILAARTLGASNFRIIVYHIFPNVMSIVIVTMTIIAGNLILVESGLSFLGVGVQPPTPTWGNMLTDSRSYFVSGTHLIIYPGLMIMITVLCFYLVGDGLRDALDPRTTRKIKV